VRSSIGASPAAACFSDAACISGSARFSGSARLLQDGEVPIRGSQRAHLRPRRTSSGRGAHLRRASFFLQDGAHLRRASPVLLLQDGAGDLPTPMLDGISPALRASPARELL
jgi:hypothetical protein